MQLFKSYHSIWRLIVFIVCMIFWQFLPEAQVSGDVAFAQLVTPEPDSVSTERVTLSVQGRPDKVPLDQLFTVEITLQGDSSQCGQTEVIKPVDVFLVLDRSGSMRDQNKMGQARQASVVFLGEMNQGLDRVGVVVFDNTASVLQQVTGNFSDVQKVIESIEANGGTDVAAGLTAAYQSLNPIRRADAVPVIIVLSDGQSSASAIAHAANTAKADGFVVVAVGLGRDVDEDAMHAMASQDIDGNAFYYFAPDPSNLNDIYLAIARAIRQYGLASDVQIQYQVDIYRYQIIVDSLQPAGTISGDTIMWQQDVLDAGSTTFSFQARGRNPGEYPVGKVLAKFEECEQDFRELRLDETPLVNIVQVIDPPLVPQVCDNHELFPWWVLIPLLLLLLGTLLSFSPSGRRFWRRFLSRALLCKLVFILLLLSLLLLAALIAHALIGQCKSPDIYFWKIVAGGEVGVYQAEFDSEQLEPITTLNQGSNCVACHQASNNLQIAAMRNEQNGDVVAINHNGHSIALPAVRASYLAWSPDGKKLALSHNDEDIYILDIETGVLNPLPGASEPGWVETMPAWSPDGQTIAFVRAPRTAPPPDTAEIREPCDIYTVPAEGGTALPLPGASGNGFNYYPSYSPNGKWLAFTRHVDGQDTYADDAADIYIIPAEGTQNPARLTINSEYSDSWPSWSPDSKWLGFSSNRREGQFDIFVSPIGDNGLPYELVYDKDGNRSSVFKLPAASSMADEEFHPVWVVVAKKPPLERLLDLWPWLIPFFILLLLALFACREPKYTVEVEVIDGLTGKPISQADIQFYKQEASE